MRTHTQGGMALVVGLIMLALMTLMAVASFNVGKVSMEIIGNMQQRSEVIAAAESLIQEAISTRRLYEAPESVVLVPCAGPNTKCYDTNADGTNDVTVELTPTPACIQAAAIANSALNFMVVGQSNCTVEEDAGRYGIEGAAVGNSLCANSLWHIEAAATDDVTNASVTIVEGVAILVQTSNVATFCPAGPT